MKTIERYRRAEEAGRRAIQGWLRYDLVRRAVDRIRPIAADRATPLASRMPDQESLVLFWARCLDIGGRYPDGEEWPNPMRGHPLQEKEAEAAATLLAEVRYLADWLEANGVPIDPEAPENALVLFQLILLQPPWKDGLDAVLDGLTILPPGSFSRDGRTITTSDHASDAFVRDLSSIRREYRKQAGRAHIRTPYAQGGSRRRPHRTVRLEETLRELVGAFPGLTAEKLLAYWDREPEPAVVEAAKQLGLPELPDRSTLLRRWPR